jgi:hypothetical protein
MPTPSQLEAARRQQELSAQGDFEVHEVIECVSSDDEHFGEEDLLEHKQILTIQEQLTRRRRLAAAAAAAQQAEAAKKADAARDDQTKGAGEEEEEVDLNDID